MVLQERLSNVLICIVLFIMDGYMCRVFHPKPGFTKHTHRQFFDKSLSKSPNGVTLWQILLLSTMNSFNPRMLQGVFFPGKEDFATRALNTFCMRWKSKNVMGVKGWQIRWRTLLNLKHVWLWVPTCGLWPHLYHTAI